MPPRKKLKLEKRSAAEAEEGSDASGGVEEAAAEAAEPEEAPAEKSSGPPELEGDAPDDSRPRIAVPVDFLPVDMTLNVMHAPPGGLLTSFREGGLQYLFAGARASLGIKTGRYIFEASIVELSAPNDTAALQHMPTPRSFLRVGFSTAGTVPIMGDCEDSICFESDGTVLSNQKRLSASKKFTRGDTVAVLLNLDEASLNANTVSLFKEGVRVTEPQPLPDSLRGKPLFPTVTFKNMTVHVNFGPTPHVQLPFKCRMVRDAAKEDVAVTSFTAPKDGKYEVLFPVSLPDQGTFDWLDWFLEENPQYAELSDRSLIDWAVRSGLSRSKTSSHSQKNSLDRPDMNFGRPLVDDGGLMRLLRTITPAQQRHFVVMEVQGNLTKEERIERLKCFRWPHFRTVAEVLVGEPSAAFKRRTSELLLKDQQERLQKEARDRKQERFRKKMIEFRQQQSERARKRAVRIKKKMDLERKRKLQAEDPKKEAGTGSDKGGEQAHDKDAKEESEEDLEEEEPKAPRLEDEEDDDLPQAELTVEEKELWFRKPGAVGDLSSFALNSSFSKFCLPEREEGFDEIRYSWQPAAECTEYMRRWVGERKLSTRVEDLRPSDWFKGKWNHWLKDLKTWQAKMAGYRDPKKRTAKIPAKAGKSSWGEGAEVGGDEPAQGDAQKEKPTVEEDLGDPEEMLEEEMELLNMDIFAVEDICSVGKGLRPLFAGFEFEDWTLLTLRFELHLLVHAFNRDCPDPERKGIPPEHLPFYFSKYYKKVLNPKTFGAETVLDIIELVGDTVAISAKGRVVESLLAADLESNDIFVKLTEESRRNRQCCVDAGDGSMQLCFPNRPTEPVWKPAALVSAPLAAGPVKLGATTSHGLQQPAPRLPGLLRFPAQNRIRQVPYWYAPRTITLNAIAAQRAAMMQQGWRPYS